MHTAEIFLSGARMIVGLLPLSENFHILFIRRFTRTPVVGITWTPLVAIAWTLLGN